MIFIKPDGREIEVNENSASHAESIGWKKKEAEVKTEQKRETITLRKSK